MFARCREIVRLLLLGCIVVQLTWLTGGSTPDDKKTTDDYLQTRMISWSAPAAEPHSRIILPSNLDPRIHPIFKIHMYQKYEISPVEIQSIMENNGGEKLKDRQARTHVPAEEISDHRERNYVRVAQGEISRTTNERNSSAEEETKVDLSFLDNLGGLAPYLPDVEDSKAPNTFPNKEASSDNWYQGIFNWFLSKLGITSKATNVNGMTMMREGFYYINKTLEKPDETKTYLLPKIRGRYVEASWTSVDPRQRLRLITELDRGNLTLISETPILRPTNRSKVTTSPSIAPSSHGNYKQPVVENYLVQKLHEIINSAAPPIRDAVNFNRNATATIESRKSKRNTYKGTVRIHSEYSKVMHRSNDSTNAPAAS